MVEASEAVTFEAVIEEGAQGGAVVIVPPWVDHVLGGDGRIPVAATVDGLPYQGSVATRAGVRCVGVLKAIREQLGKSVGDTVTVTLARDESARRVGTPEDLAAALDASGLRAAFEALSPSHRREHVQWINDAKKPATRARRVAATIERLGGPGRA